MTNGYIRAAAATPPLRVADVNFNVEAILRQAAEASAAGVKVLVFPELCITAYTCGDLFLQEALLLAARKGLQRIIDESLALDVLLFVGLPFAHEGRLYNVAAAVKGGRLLALIPKQNIPNYTEFYEARYFSAGPSLPRYIKSGFKQAGEGSGKSIGERTGESVLFGANVLLRAEDGDSPVIACEICEDLWTAQPPSARHAEAGAEVIVNLSASDETAGKAAFRRSLVGMQSVKLLSAYIYAGAGPDESSTDLVFGGQRIVAEDGVLLSEGRLYETGLTAADIDVLHLRAKRRQTTTFPSYTAKETEARDSAAGLTAGYETVAFPGFHCSEEERLLRRINPHPFVPHDEEHRAERCREIFAVQANGLKKRLKHIGAKKVVIGLSGGLDSTLALLVTREAFRLLGLPAEDILCVTMPAFGTTDRTYQNACTLAKEVGAELREINIKKSVLQHFEDIGHDPSIMNAVYENGQARERTQILMDIANDINGIVIGTGDLSEMALGWCTYNGDHMSMYAVNADVPKTLVRYLVRFVADTEENKRLQAVLYDVLDTPVSPELLPATEDGKISQKTEDLVGPYELHDFFLYQVLRFGFTPARIYLMAKQAFDGTADPSAVYDEETILHWLYTFYRRFFSQQFKRSCSVDGPKVGSVDLSPRGGWRMPSDAAATLWMTEIEQLKEALGKAKSEKAGAEK